MIIRLCQFTSRCRAVFLLSTILALFPTTLGAQNPLGALRGTVQDATGGRVPAARVVVTAANSAIQREAQSDEGGEFRIDGLPPGSYHVTVQAKGFADSSSEVGIAVSSVREITITLKLQALRQQTITLDGDQSITTQPIDTESSVHQTIIT